MDMDVIKSASRAAREEFERRVAATGLEIANPTRGGYLITRWGNEGRDIEQALEAQALDYYRNVCGGYNVNSWPLERAAIIEALAQAPRIS